MYVIYVHIRAEEEGVQVRSRRKGCWLGWLPLYAYDIYMHAYTYDGSLWERPQRFTNIFISIYIYICMHTYVYIFVYSIYDMYMKRERNRHACTQQEMYTRRRGWCITRRRGFWLGRGNIYKRNHQTIHFGFAVINHNTFALKRRRLYIYIYIYIWNCLEKSAQ